MTAYTTLEGDVLDAIVARHYGTTSAAAMLPAVLAANPGLVFAALTLPRGLTITLPPLNDAAAGSAGTGNVIRLWGTL